jgi:hypothetical protein
MIVIMLSRKLRASVSATVFTLYIKITQLSNYNLPLSFWFARKRSISTFSRASLDDCL